MASFINSTKTTNWMLLLLFAGVLVAGGVYFWNKKKAEDADAILINKENPETPVE